MMKEIYKTPEMEVIKFETEDIITTSSFTYEDGELPFVPVEK